MSEVTRIQVGGQSAEEARIASPQSSTTDSAIGTVIQNKKIPFENSAISELFLDSFSTTNLVICDSFVKVNSVQEACTKCFAVHNWKFEILQITWKNETDS